MGWIFSCRAESVVAGIAGAEHMCMIYRRNRTPHRSIVTGPATIAGEYMQHRFAGGGSPVMAAVTGLSQYRTVIEVYRPVGCRVTTIAGARGKNMIRAFAYRQCAVVTRGATPNHLGMIHRQRRYPHGSNMTGLAGVPTRYVGGGFTGGVDPIVTGCTGLTANPTMIEQNLPGIDAMAAIASSAGLNMVAMFPGGDDPVMTTGTGAAYLGMINGKTRPPGGIDMTLVA